MSTNEKHFEVGGFARHNQLLKSTNLLVLNINENEVLTRYDSNGVFYTQIFFKFELEPYIKKPVNISGINIR